MLTRAIMAGSVLVFGFGAALYACAWLLLPDAGSGRIFGEELVGGHWDWMFVGPFVCLAVAVMMTRLGVPMAVLAVGAFLLVVNNQAQRWRQTGGYGKGGGGGAEPGVHAGGSGAASQAYAQYAQRPVASSDPPTEGPYGYYAGAPTAARPAPATVPSGASSTQPPYAAASPSPWTPPPWTPPAHTNVRRLRRKPAGFAVVMILSGLILLSTAGMLIAIPDNADVETELRYAMFWISGVCLLLGVVILLLGLIGRRAGGLIPFACLAIVLAVAMVSFGGVYSSTIDDAGYTNARYMQMKERSRALVDRLLNDVTTTLEENNHE